MATQRIDTKTTRLRLSPRREPYWHKITSGGHVGYRRTESGGSWLARYRPKDGKRQFESFGEFPDIDPVDQFDHAQKAAIDWINSLGITTEAGYTVKKAIDDYVKYLRINNSDSSATQTQQRLYKRIPSKLQAAKLTKLTLKQVTDWHCSMITESKDKHVTRRSKDTANRILSMFKAALNLAFRNNIIATDLAWRRVSAFKNVTASRKVILTDQHIQQLYENTEGGFHCLIKSALLTGARYGELIQAKVSDFDPREGTLYLDGKTGSRECYLNAETVQHLLPRQQQRIPYSLQRKNEQVFCYA